MRARLWALEPAWLLSDLYVDESARRLGVGEALMNAARAHAEATGACGLQLETARTNLAGQRLYERLGWTAIDTERYEGRNATIMQIEPSAAPTT